MGRPKELGHKCNIRTGFQRLPLDKGMEDISVIMAYGLHVEMILGGNTGLNRIYFSLISEEYDEEQARVHPLLEKVLM